MLAIKGLTYYRRVIGIALRIDIDVSGLEVGGSDFLKVEKGFHVVFGFDIGLVVGVGEDGAVEQHEEEVDGVL